MLGPKENHKTSLRCLGENQESVDGLFSDSNVCSFLTNGELTQHVLTIHITDQRLYSNFPLVMKVQLSASKKSLQVHDQLFVNLVKMADHLSTKYQVPH